MLRHISPEQLMESDEFVLEPVQELEKKIDMDSHHTILLQGKRGSGKTVFLHHAERGVPSSSKATIYTWFDAVSTLPPLDEVFYLAFYEHYYEISLCQKLLNYIEENYCDFYELYFEELEEEVMTYSYMMHYYMQNAYYEKVSIDHFLSIGEISNRIISIYANMKQAS